jgi:uncharacterized protein (DUF934 family)
MTIAMKLIAANARDHWAAAQNEPKAGLWLANDADAMEVPLDGVERIALQFPKFSDGRAFSQAFLLRRRRGFTGDICAVGDVLIDQLAQMQRCGFSSALLREDQSLAAAERVLAGYPGFEPGAYQGDAVHVAPHFADAA